MPHRSTLTLKGRTLTFFDTPGHARHHVSIHDSKSGGVFTGDTFGLSYRELDQGGRQFVFPTTTPVQFDPDAAHTSLNMIAGLHPPMVYVTHFGEVRDISRLTADMHRLIDAHVALARSAAHSANGDRHLQLTQGLEQLVDNEAQRQGWNLSRTELRALFRKDIELNAQGLAVWLDRG